MKLDDFKGKKILIMGLGLQGGGVGVAKFFAKTGAEVLITDLKSKSELKSSLNQLKPFPQIQYHLGGHIKEDFTNCDLIVKNPAVPDNSCYLEIARSKGISIDTEMGLFFKLCPAKIIGISGSKGKSTTSVLLYNFLKKQHKRVFLVGNIGVSALQTLNKIKKEDFVIAELSSWQLEGLKSHKKSPSFALLTNILPDHLNRYRNYRDYINSKKLIFAFQRENDCLILNYENPILKKLIEAGGIKSKLYIYGRDLNILTMKQWNNEAPNQNDSGQAMKLGAWIDNNKIVFGKKRECLLKIRDLPESCDIDSPLFENILGAITLAYLLGVEAKHIKEVLGRFRGLPGRIEKIKIIKGVEYINDTTATNPSATMAAIHKLQKRREKHGNIILIAGGVDKNLSYKDFVKVVFKNIKTLFLLPGTASDKIQQEIDRHSDLPSDFQIIPVDSLKKAVFGASKLAKEGDIVLLSPAAASFNLFINEFDRGEQYNQCVRLIG